MRLLCCLCLVLSLCASRLLAAPLHDAVMRGDYGKVTALLKADSRAITAREYGWQPLHLAALRGRKDITLALLAADAPAGAAGKLGATPLHLAAYAGSSAVVATLLQHKVPVNGADLEGVTPLHLAAMHDQPVVLRQLLVAGAKVDARDRAGVTPLFAAAARGSLPCVTMLLSKGANPDATPLIHPWTPLHLAAYNGDTAVATALLAKGARIDGAVGAQYTPLGCALSRGDDAIRYLPIALTQTAGSRYMTATRELWPFRPFRVVPLPPVREDKLVTAMATLLINRKANLRTPSGTAVATPLHLAVRDGRTALVKLLLAKGADPRAVDRADATPITLACADAGAMLDRLLDAVPATARAKVQADAFLVAAEHGQLAAVKRMRQRGTPLTAATSRGQTALHLAAKAGQTAMVAYLLQAGASKLSRDTSGGTPLLVATATTAVPLLKAGADPTVVDAQGNTLLHRVATGEILKLAKSVPLETRNAAGLTPLLAAVDRGDAVAAAALLKAGADPTACDRRGDSAWRNALEQPTAEVLKAFLDAKCDVNARLEDGLPPLLVAVPVLKNEATVKVLLDKGADPAARDLFGRTALHLLPREGEATADRLLATTADLNARDTEGNTPLHTAVSQGAAGVAARLLDAGADPNARNATGRTPLHLAVSTRQLPMLALLLGHGADVNSVTATGETPMHLAAGLQNLRLGANMTATTPQALVQTLLASGASRSLRNSTGRTAREVAESSKNTEVVTLLEAPEQTIGPVDAGPEATHPLAAAITAGDVPKLQALIKEQPNRLTAVNLSGDGALHLAARLNKPEAMAALLDDGADPEAVNLRGETPLHVAASQGAAACSDVLCARKVQLNRRDLRGQTPLHAAVGGRQLALVRALLAVGALPDIRDYRGETPLLLAVRMGLLESLPDLLRQGAGLREVDYQGRNAVLLAAESGKADVLAALLAQGAPADAVDVQGRQAVHLASTADVLTRLLDAGAKIDARDFRGNTPLHLATTPVMAKAQMEAGANPRATNRLGEMPLFTALARGKTAVLPELIAKDPLADIRDVDGNTPLLLALQQKQFEAVKLLRATADPAARNARGETALHLTANVEFLRDFARTPGLLEATDREGQTPLLRQIAVKQEKAALALLEAGARATPAALHAAIAVGMTELIFPLLDRGVDVNAPDADGRTPLLAALDAGQWAMATLLLDRKADPRATTRMKQTALHLAVSRATAGTPEEYHALLERLLKAATDVNARDARGATPLHLAARALNTEAVSQLLAHKAAVDPLDVEGETPLLTALAVRAYGRELAQQAVCTALADAGARQRFSSPELVSSGHVAIRAGRATLVPALLAHGLDARAADGEGRTLLHLAAQYGAVSLVDSLVKAGAEVNARDADGLTPLGDAVRTGGLETAKALVRQGAALSTRTRDGRTLLHLASTADVITWLLGTGLRADTTDAHGRAPLHALAQLGAVGKELDAAMTLLLKHGAELDTRDDDGRTPLFLAVQAGRATPAALLLRLGANPRIKDKDGQTLKDLLDEGTPAELRALVEGVGARN